MPKAEKIFHEALRSTVWIGAMRQVGEGRNSAIAQDSFWIARIDWY